MHTEWVWDKTDLIISRKEMNTYYNVIVYSKLNYYNSLYSKLLKNAINIYTRCPDIRESKYEDKSISS